MSHLWVQQQSRTDPWALLPMDAGPDVLVMTGNADRPVAAGDGTRPNGADAYMLRHRLPGGIDQWILFASADAAVYMNGIPLALGMHVMRDRDEIRIGRSGSLIFSDERLARVEPFPGADKKIKCPRCRTTIRKGMPAVRCPQCGLWYHQRPEKNRPCWTYTPKCMHCDQPTDLDADYRWTPEGL